jgi:hypothetical protein
MGWRGFGFVRHSRTLFCHAVPNPNITIRNFCIAVAGRPGERHARSRTCRRRRSRCAIASPTASSPPLPLRLPHSVSPCRRRRSRCAIASPTASSPPLPLRLPHSVSPCLSLAALREGERTGAGTSRGGFGVRVRVRVWRMYPWAGGLGSRGEWSLG